MAELDSHKADVSVVRAKINSTQYLNSGNIDTTGISAKEKTEYLVQKRLELSRENKTKIDSIKSSILKEVEKDSDGKISRNEMRGIYMRVQDSRSQELTDLQINDFDDFLRFIGLKNFYDNWQEQSFNENEEKLLGEKLGLKSDDLHELVTYFSRCGINIKQDLTNIAGILDQIKPTKGLTADEVAWIKYNIQTSLFLLLSSYTKELKSKDTSYKWHFNDKTSESFSDFYKTIIRAAIFVADYSEKGHEEGAKPFTDKEKGTEAKAYNRLKNILTKKISFDDKGLCSELNSFGYMGTMSHPAGKGNHSFEVPALKRAADKTQTMSDDANYLNEKDRKIDEQVKAKYLVALLVQCVPVAGTAISVPVDIADLVSRQDGTVSLLKSMNLIPKDYVMQSNFFVQKGFALGDLILSVIALLTLETIPVDSIADIGRMLKLAPKFIKAALKGLKEIKIEETISEIATKLGKQISAKKLSAIARKLPDLAATTAEYKSRT